MADTDPLSTRVHARSTNTEDETDNHLLANLSADDVARLTPHLEPVALPQNRVLFDAGDEISHVYLLRSGLASRIVQMADGATVEAGVIGRDGLAGLNACFGMDTAAYQIVMRIRGVGFKMPVAVYRTEFERAGPFRTAVLRYAAAVEAHTSIMAACNRLHSAEQRLARWLLVASRLTGESELPITQELLAGALGMRRLSVTFAAKTFKSAGVVEYKRGQLRILDHEQLRARACECCGRLETQTEL